MKLTAFTSPNDMVAALGLDADAEVAVRKVLEEHDVTSGERIEFDVEVDADEAYDKLDDLGMIPDPDLSELVQADDLADAVQAALDGDRHMALLLFTRALGGDGALARRIEDVIRGRPADGQPPLPLLVAA